MSAAESLPLVSDHRLVLADLVPGRLVRDVALTVGGAALFCPYKAVTVATNATPEFAINALLVQI